MDPLGIVLMVVLLVLGTLSLVTRKSVDRATRRARHRSFRFARLALRTWLQHRRDQEPEEPESLMEAAKLIRHECRRRGTKEPRVVSVLLMPVGVERLEALAALAPTEELNSVEIPPTLDPDRNSLDGLSDRPSYEGLSDRPSYEGISERDDPFDLPEFLKPAETSR